MDQPRDWAKESAADIGRRVALYRERLKISGQQLADRCAELGMPSISRIVITKLENGRREAVSTAELQVLAAALDVPVIVLLTGLSTTETTEILPGAVVEPYDAVQWLIGETSGPGTGGPPETNPMSLYGLHQSLVSVWRAEQLAKAQAIKRLSAATTPDERREAEELADLPVTLADGNTQQLRRMRALMRRLGYVLPRLPADIARAIGEEVPDGSR